MASVVVQFRVEEDLKNEAAQVYENIGVDLSSALRTFLKRSIKEKGYPFEMNVDQKRRDDATKLMMMFEKQAIDNGIGQMSLDSINEEIENARKSRKKWVF